MVSHSPIVIFSKYSYPYEKNSHYGENFFS